jgi:hypothetical protein
MRRPPDIATLRAAVWTYRALRQVRSGLKKDGLSFEGAPEPPALPASAARGVDAVLRRQPNTCLERAIVLQRWHQAQGNPRDVVIAVRGAPRDFAAHAWLDGEPDRLAPAYAELMRLPAR